MSDKSLLRLTIEEVPLLQDQQWRKLLEWIKQSYAQWPYIFTIAFLEKIEKHVQKLTEKREKKEALKAVLELNARIPHSNATDFFFPTTWEINGQKNSGATLYQSYDPFNKDNRFHIRVQQSDIVGHTLSQKAIGFTLSNNVRENAAVLYSFMPKNGKQIVALDAKWGGSQPLFYYLLAYQKLYDQLKPLKKKNISDFEIKIRWSDQKERPNPSEEQFYAAIQEITRGDSEIQTLLQLNHHP